MNQESTVIIMLPAIKPEIGTKLKGRNSSKNLVTSAKNIKVRFNRIKPKATTTTAERMFLMIGFLII